MVEHAAPVAAAARPSSANASYGLLCGGIQQCVFYDTDNLYMQL